MESFDTTSILEVLTLMVAILVITQIAVLWLVLRIRRKTMTPLELLAQSRVKTENTIQKAIAQANKIIIAAQLKGMRLISREKVDSNMLAQEFEAHLRATEKVLEEQLGHNAEHATAVYMDFIHATEKIIDDHIVQNQKMLEQKSQVMVEKTEGLLAKLSSDVESTIRSQLEGELTAAKKEIAVYREARMKVIDERIVDILEEVLSVTLEKKLTLADQSELVYKALEQAKRENAFSKTT